MKLLVISDTHGSSRLLWQVLHREADADAIIFLGDGLREMVCYQEENPTRRIYLVRGNCDYGFAEYPAEAVTAFGGINFLLTHGHEYQIKMTLGLLAQVAADRGAEVVLFGHTHMPFSRAENGLYLFNPGSLGRSRSGDESYGIIQIADARAEFRIVRIQDM